MQFYYFFLGHRTHPQDPELKFMDEIFETNKIEIDQEHSESSS